MAIKVRNQRPVLRLTFANFTSPERRKLGEKVKQGGDSTIVIKHAEEGFDAGRAEKGLAVVWELLGYGANIDLTTFKKLSNLP